MITKQALKAMAETANDLDDLGMYKEANLVTDKIIKMAQVVEEVPVQMEQPVEAEQPVDMKQLSDDASNMYRIIYQEILGVLDFVELRVEFMQNLETKYVSHLRDNEFNKKYNVGYNMMRQKIKQLKMFFEKRADEYAKFIDETRMKRVKEEEKQRLLEISEQEKKRIEEEREQLQKYRVDRRY